MDNTGTYAHFDSEEDNGTVIRECINDISTAKIAHLACLWEYIPCDKSKVRDAFNRVVKYHKDKYFGVIVSMDDNLPTEALEQLTK